MRILCLGGRRGGRGLARGLAGVLAAALLLACLAPVLLAAPPSLEALVSLLVRSRGEKVRVQACLLLGKRRDRRAIPTLVRALYDDKKSVRMSAAQALGKIGDPSALDGLKKAAAKTDPASAAVMRRVIASLGPGPSQTPQAPVGRPMLYLGPLADRTGTQMRDVFHGYFERALRKATQLQVSAAASARGGTGFYVDGTVERMLASDRGRGAIVRCDVKVLVATWPSKSILMWTDGGASVETGQDDASVRAAMPDCLEAAVQTVADNVAEFVRSRL